MPRLVTLSHVDPLHLDILWPRITSVLAWKTSSQPFSLGVLKACLRAGTRDLWAAPDWRFPTRFSSVIVTAIVVRPDGKHLQIHLLSGRHIGTWIASAACTLGQFAQANGCTRLEITGRRGWRPFVFRQFTLPVTWLTAREGSVSADRNQNQ
jgi:hypothetical protein